MDTVLAIAHIMQIGGGLVIIVFGTMAIYEIARRNK